MFVLREEMMNCNNPDPTALNKQLAAVCGLFCPACTFFIGSTEEPERLGKLAHRFGLTASDVECYGCRSDKRGIFCNKYCKMTRCADNKGIDFCVQCDEYPCAELRAFQEKMPHRIELWESQERIKNGGWEAWYTEMIGHYSCTKCHTVNSAYDLTCRQCGADPSSEYTRVHREQIMKYVDKMGR
jgi:hypothetical protein